MNRAEKRRQKKLAEKAVGKAQQPPDIRQALELAIGHHTAGRLAEAEGLYQHILQTDPNQPEAWCAVQAAAFKNGRAAAMGIN